MTINKSRLCIDRTSGIRLLFKWFPHLGASFVGCPPRHEEKLHTDLPGFVISTQVFDEFFFFLNHYFVFELWPIVTRLLNRTKKTRFFSSSLHNLIKLFYFTHAGGFKEVHSCEWEGSNQKRSITTFWRTMPFGRLGVDTCETNLQRSSISACYWR